MQANLVDLPREARPLTLDAVLARYDDATRYAEMLRDILHALITDRRDVAVAAAG